MDFIVHLEGFGDLQGVAQAKGEIYRGLTQDGVAIINNDDDFASYWKGNISNPCLTFALENDADLRAENIIINSNSCAEFDIQYNNEKVRFRLSVPGKHNILNALAAIAICSLAELSLNEIAKQLTLYTGVAGRLQIHNIADDLVIIDDTYNANYTSLVAGIDVLCGYEGKKYLALGDMGELGNEAKEYHHKAGEYAKQAGVDCLLTVGVLSQFAHQAFGDGSFHFMSQPQLTDFLLKKLQQTKGAVLFKGSRSAHMENVVSPIVGWAEEKLGGAQ